MLGIFETVCDLFNHMPTLEFFNILIKCAMCVFAIVPAINTICGSVVSSIMPMYTRLSLIEENNVVFYGIGFLVNIPPVSSAWLC